MDIVVQRRDGPRWLREHDDDDDGFRRHLVGKTLRNVCYSTVT